ncbi:MAG: PI-PLC domain-containing protein [Leptospirales bacterium]
MWIIGDGGSPARAPDNTLSSFEMAIAEWADGLLAHTRQTTDHLLVLSRLEKIRTPQGDHSLETLDRETLKGLQPLHPPTGEPYSLLALSEWLDWIGTRSIRTFIEPLGTILSEPQTLDQLGKMLLEARARIPPALVLPGGVPAPAGFPEERIWRTFSREADFPSEKERPKIQAILPVELALSGQCNGLKRILVTTSGPVPEINRLRRLPGFWGVVTPHPYFTRKAAAAVPTGGAS